MKSRFGWTLRDKCVIAGVATVGYFRHTDRSEASLGVEAVMNAAQDAGISVRDIDGLITYQYNNDTVRPQEIAQALGIPKLRFWLENWLGGTIGAGLMGIAAMAINSGLARNVVVYRSVKHRSGRVRIGGSGNVADTGGLEQFLIPIGWANFYTSIAAEAVRYMHEHALTREHLSAVAILAYKNAQLNDRAVGKGRGPKTTEEYMSAPMLAYPFCRWDFTTEVDGACAYLVTSASMARDLRKRPVYITSIAQSATPNPMHMGRFAHYDLVGSNAVTGSSAYFADELFAVAGVRREDVDVALLYDAASYEVIKQLEDMGFCAKGDGGLLAMSGALDRDGSLPVNPNGGLLAEGYAHGTNMIIEAVEQLRGESGVRQVPNPKVALFTSGAAASLGGGGILTVR